MKRSVWLCRRSTRRAYAWECLTFFYSTQGVVRGVWFVSVCGPLGTLMYAEPCDHWVEESEGREFC